MCYQAAILLMQSHSHSLSKAAPKLVVEFFLESFTDDALDIYKPGYGKRR